MSIQAEAVSGIVTDGLKLYLDASNPASYPGSGTTWNDLSGNSNNGTMVNGVVPVSNAMQFDGVNDSVALPPTTAFIGTTTPFTLSSFIKINAYSPEFPQIFDLKSNICNFQLFVSNRSEYTGVVIGGKNTWACGKSNTTPTYFMNKYVNIVVTYNGINPSTMANFEIYIDTIETSMTTIRAFGVVNNNKNTIGNNNVLSLYNNFNGYINDTLIYSKVLTEPEVIQNYNTLKAKYGL